ncbi:hypothetical protein B0H13DRAFT_1909754 [Mycena leptocephala]|nr:hypothetical protein B0H13DRAFT_1909754 [Mycena leptocephala]
MRKRTGRERCQDAGSHLTSGARSGEWRVGSGFTPRGGRDDDRDVVDRRIETGKRRHLNSVEMRRLFRRSAKTNLAGPTPSHPESRRRPSRPTRALDYSVSEYPRTYCPSTISITAASCPNSNIARLQRFQNDVVGPQLPVRLTERSEYWLHALESAFPAKLAPQRDTDDSLTRRRLILLEYLELEYFVRLKHTPNTLHEWLLSTLRLGNHGFREQQIILRIPEAIGLQPERTKGDAYEAGAVIGD